MTRPVVQVRDVFVAYRGAAGSVMALRGSDLTLALGERLLVQGPNGSGKTTLLRVITGELPVAAGTVVVSGTALLSDRRERHWWRAHSVGSWTSLPPAAYASCRWCRMSRCSSA
jgi:peptide/nickel transport system ATP-binding protein/energy-coupling factor transport system ATP-binding protein